MYKLLISLLLLAIFPRFGFSKEITGICAQKLKQKKFLKVQNKYATGFSIKKYKGFFSLTLNKSWDNSSRPQHIFLVENRLNFPSTCQRYFNIKIPVKKVASLSTSHLAAIELLDELKSLKAFSNLNLAFNPIVQKGGKEGDIFELGSPPSGERLLALRPDVIFSYATADPKVEGISKLINLKLPLVFISEFREKHPLARAEWIKVFGLLYNKLKLAKSKFREIENKYNEISEAALQVKVKRRVMIGELIKGTWKAPGGGSDLSTLISDAGGEYIWEKEKSASTLSINIEKVLMDGAKAEVWFPHNMATSLKDLTQDEVYKKLNFIENVNILNNTKKMSVGGGNDYWESALMRPDLLIQDLFRIFHPILIPNHELIWYQKLE